MVTETLRMWTRSIVLRLMVPVAMMFVLVCLIGLVGAVTRTRVHRAYDAVMFSQSVHTDLSEMRSLSPRQRDALNLSLESNRRELGTLDTKFSTRSREPTEQETAWGRSRR